jgi:hypothetical protein
MKRMRTRLLSFLGAVSLALTVGYAKPMMVNFDADNGRYLSSTIYTPTQIDVSEAKYITCLNDVSRTSANVQVLNNGNGGVITLYLTW